MCAVGAILDRFRNPAIQHRLSQIAWDGSQKIPVRLLGTIADALAAGRPIDRLCLPVAGWMRFVRSRAHAGVTLVDPLAEVLADVGRTMTGATSDVDVFLRLDAVFAPLSADARFVEALRVAYLALGDASPDTVARALSSV